MPLNTAPLWLSGLLVAIIPTAIAMSGPVLIRRWFSLDRLRVNNEVAGFKFATVGVLYAVLLAFAVIVVWEKFGEAERTAGKEAGAVAILYRLSNEIDPENGQKLHEGLTAYARSVIKQDWPAMAQGRNSEQTKHALDSLYATTLTFSRPDSRGAVLLTEALQQLGRITETRRDRLLAARGNVPGVLWLALTLGAVVTVAFTFFLAPKTCLLSR